MGVIHFDADFSRAANGFPCLEMDRFEPEEDILNGADFFVVHLPETHQDLSASAAVGGVSAGKMQGNWPIAIAIRNEKPALDSHQ